MKIISLWSEVFFLFICMVNFIMSFKQSWKKRSVLKIGGLQSSNGNAQREIVWTIWVWRGQGIWGQGSQMKQIKGEPWPPGETLAGHRDWIQMGDQGRGVQGTLLLSIPLSVSLLFFWFLSPRLKFPKEQHLWDVPCLDWGIKVAGMPFSPCLSPRQLVCLPAAHPVCQQAQPDLPAFYLSVTHWI